MTTDASAERARKALNELFKSHPWLARNDTCVPGCGHLLWCDLAALRAAEQPASLAISQAAKSAERTFAEQPAPEKGETKIFGLPVDKPCPSSPADAGSGEDDATNDAELVALLRSKNPHLYEWAEGAMLSAAGRITRLTSDLSAAREQIAQEIKWHAETSKTVQCFAGALKAIEAERDALSQEVARLREALQPFVEVFDRYPITTDDSHGIMFALRDLRRAASLARGE